MKTCGKNMRSKPTVSGLTGDICPDPVDRLKSASEEHLISAAKFGEHCAYVELCGRRRESIFLAVHRITRNREDTEDAIQDALMKGFIHIRTFDGRSAFSTWLTRIAINSALMILRKRKGHIEVSLTDHPDDDTSEIPVIVEPSHGPEEHCIRRQRELLLRQAVLHLPPNLRTIVEIHQAQEGSIQEIATTIGISVPAAKSRLMRARVRLRKHLSGRLSTMRCLLMLLG